VNCEKKKIPNERPREETYRKLFRQHLLAFPPHFTSYLKKLHVAVGEVRSMVGVKHEHAPAWSDSSLTSREQRTMLFRPKHLSQERREKRIRVDDDYDDDG
jgi:hypothetical protein